MKALVTTRAALLAASLFAVGCGPAATPQTTTTPSPFIAQVGGVWDGTQTLTSMGGGHCEPVLLRVGVPEPLSFAVQQTEVDLSARMMSAGTGLACDY